MDTKDIQKQTYDFEKEQGWLDQTPDYAMMLLTEEVGELAREIRRIEVGRYGHNHEKVTRDENLDNIALEMGDILLAMAKIANYYDIDMGEGFAKALEKTKKRF